MFVPALWRPRQVRRCLGPLRLFRLGLVVGACAAAIVSMSLPASLAAQPLSRLAQVGKQIYREGVDPRGGDIIALIGVGGAEAPAAILPCVNCHGHDGLGREEGGVLPSNITWEALTKPYGARHTDGRSHPPYDAQTLKRAFTMGFDAAGNELQAAMPRYRMSHATAEALTAYLEVLGNEQEPGLTEDRIRLGVLLPPSGPLTEMSEAIRAILNAYFEDLNQQGGIYGRQLELAFLSLPATVEARREAVRSFLEGEQVFACVSAYLSGAEGAIASELERSQTPLVGAFSLYAESGAAVNRYVFHLAAGLGNQGRALLRFAVAKADETVRRVTIARAGGNGLEVVVRAIVQESSRQGMGGPWSEIEEIEIPAGSFDAVKFTAAQQSRGTDVLFFLGRGLETQQLLAEARDSEWRPLILLWSAFAGDGVLGALDDGTDNVYLSFPVLPEDRQPSKLRYFDDLAKRNGLPSRHRSVQLHALASAEVLKHALEESGRNASREKLVDILESLHSYDTGLTPRLTYGPSRRVGATGAHIVSLGSGRMQSSQWIELR